MLVDRAGAGTAYRTCVRRRGTRVHTCFDDVSGPASAANVTPLRFPRGRYAVTWSVAGAVVARWRFVVV